MNILAGDFLDPRVIELLRIHYDTAREQSPPCSAHALDLTGLQAADISLWAAWKGETLMGVGALKLLTPDHGEVKSMHTLYLQHGFKECEPFGGYTHDPHSVFMTLDLR